MELTCKVCNETKDCSNFPKKESNASGYSTLCKPCNSIRTYSYYKTGKYKDKYADGAKECRKRFQVAVDSIKSKYGCLKCGESEACCLDFHHIETSDKEYNIASITTAKSKQRLIVELSKCVVLCSNCHRKLHSGKLILDKYEYCSLTIEDLDKLLPRKRRKSK